MTLGTDMQVTQEQEHGNQDALVLNAKKAGDSLDNEGKGDAEEKDAVEKDVKVCHFLCVSFLRS
jgi:hypothetical protein